MRLAAALAFYTTLSIPPILLIGLGLAGQVLGGQFTEQELQRQLVEQFRRLLGTQGAEAADALAAILQNADRPGGGLIATVAGLVTLGFGATGAFVQMQDALNTIWEVTPDPERGLRGLVVDRLVSFALALSIGFLMLVSLLISTALALLDEYLQGMFPGAASVMQALNFFLSLAVILMLFSTMFKFVPDVKIDWGDVWIGALVTALLFTVGKWAIGLYLGNSAIASTYGAAGSLVILLLWVYYSSSIFFLGAEFTHVYARRYGSRIVPAPSAVPLTEEMRVQQGIPSQETKEKAEMAEEAHPVIWTPMTSRKPVPLAADSESTEVEAGQQTRAPTQSRKHSRLLGYYALGALALLMGAWRWLRDR
jgi:membrane protein